MPSPVNSAFMQAAMFAFQLAQSLHNAGFVMVFPANSINQNL
ncbi:hypothetical protein SeKA_A0708 [Salmonella enterica subsp. enterica serovar Kentucky str. CVM29188]|uniref:Uncharacterized protein n=1 Tax=Salmonella enterica subsp. enterica serovar Cubana str. 76814 TaxID=1192560 RepID=V7IHZ5_SALET|nr:hypothetical protein SeKA_A0708 [Salmonella enterica subsp. enterica serovar Kentucky str. CVM29188]ETA84949.1 hypothetical protein A628_05014 [Salmonella enterica subsp. enterica serovar Cubana str. 76814]